MKKLIKFFAVVIIGITITFFSCKKDTNNSSTLASSGVVGTTISGIVFNTGHIPLSGVEVSVGNYVKTTGTDGAFLFENIPVSNDRFKVEFIKNGYFETYRSGKAEINGVTKVEVSLVEISVSEPTTYSMNYSQNTGGVLFGAVDTILVFPPNLYYVKEDGTLYYGDIYVCVKYVDASQPEYSKVVAGGDQFGRVGTSNYYLNSFSGIMVALFDDNGEKLDLASNNTEFAQVHIKIPNSMLANAPDSIDSWYNGGDLAYATNSGTGRKTGGKYTSAVGHFSLWSMQTKFSEFGTITGRITDCNGDPANGVRVQVGQSYAITNNDGIYSRVVAAGIDNIEIQVLAEDYFGNASAPIIENALTNGETRADIDIQLACVGTITGRLVNCTGNPVPGQVVVSDGVNVSKTYTENGSFELKFDQNSTNYTIRVKGYNYSTSEIVNGATFPYNAGDITLCPPVAPPVGSNNVTINGVSYSDFTTAYGEYYGSTMDLFADGNDGYFSFGIESCTGTGTYPLTLMKSINSHGSVTIDTVSYTIVSGSVVITTFDDVGGRIIGNFSGNADTGESISGEFNMRRNPDQQ